jgi:S-adenosylmethionine:tRNA ribosyltransferase-isomerase
LPASLHGRIAHPLRLAGQAVELRLLGSEGDSAKARFRAVLFGPGNWRDDTDLRPAPPRLSAGDTLACGEGLVAHVEAVDTRSPRLLTLRFAPAGDAFWNALYRLGRPIQYRYRHG